MRVLTSLSFQLLFVSFFLAIVTGTMAKETDTHHMQAIDRQVGGAASKFPTIERKSAASPPSTHLLTSTVPRNKGFWHDLRYGGRTHYVSNKATTVTKNIKQAIDGVAVRKFPTIDCKSTASPRYTHLLISTVPQGKDVWHDLWNTGKTVALDKRAATEDATQAIEGEAASTIPTIQRKNTPHPV